MATFKSFTRTEGPANSTVLEEDEAAWIPFVEPVPDWDDAKDEWGSWWYIHIYGIGSLFLVSTAYCILSTILLLRARKRLSQLAYFLALNILMLIFSLERAIFMFLDAYNAEGSIHPAVAYLFLSIGLPCMTSAFYLIFQAFAKATRLQLTTGVHKAYTMVAIIFAHFVISISLDMAAGYTLRAAELLICCQAVFILWGYTLSIMFFNLFRKVYYATVGTRRKLIKMSTDMSRFQSASMHVGCTLDGEVNPVHIQEKRPSTVSKSSIPPLQLMLGAKLIVASAILLSVIATLYLGGLFGCYMMGTYFGETPEPWPWWGFELAVRLCEVGLCWTISLSGSQPIVRQMQRKFTAWAKRNSLNSHKSLATTSYSTKSWT